MTYACIYRNQHHQHGSISNVGGVYPSFARASGPAMLLVRSFEVQGWLWYRHEQPGPGRVVAVVVLYGIVGCSVVHQLVQCTVLISCQDQTGDWGRVYRLDLSVFS